ncbi:putative DD34D transposase [Trichonephila clavipes]|nr:putative DD34D transposase [Trichonephila clavipes]
MCAKFVPRTLTPEQKAVGSAHCRDILSATENDPHFLKSMVRGDESQCFQYDSETKRQSVEWKQKISPQAKKSRKVQSKIKTMVITFFDNPGITHKELAPTGQTVAGQYYLTLLMRLMAKLCRILPEYWTKSSWCLLHDDAPSHPSLISRQFLKKNNVCMLNNPLYHLI